MFRHAHPRRATLGVLGLLAAVGPLGCAAPPVRPEVVAGSFAPLPARVRLASYTSQPARCPWWVGGTSVPMEAAASAARRHLEGAIATSGFLAPPGAAADALSLDVFVDWTCATGRFVTRYYETLDLRASDATGRVVWKDHLESWPLDRVTDWPRATFLPGFERLMEETNDRALSRLKLALGLR